LNIAPNARPTPQLIIDTLHAWLEHAFPDRMFSYTVDGMKHGTQSDYESCGLFLENTLRHDIWPKTLILNNSDRTHRRHQVFLTLLEVGRVSLSQLLIDSSLHSPVDIRVRHAV
jgi:hypothetical protein